ncbi:MAG: hypothetical protein EA412_02610 [Chitinophagaceae bacterium]|nr:MAG: hypothetical protein EA412_02610 [Chitinophagaceae bacterium]
MKKCLFTVTALYLLSCTPEIESTDPFSGDLDVQNVLIIGDSYSAGLSNAALSEDDMNNSPSQGIINAFASIGISNINSAELESDLKIGFTDSVFHSAFNLEEWVDCLGDTITFPRKIEKDIPAGNWFSPAENTFVNNISLPGLTPDIFIDPFVFADISQKPFVQSFFNDTIQSFLHYLADFTADFVYLNIGTEMIVDNILKGSLQSLLSPAEFANAVEVLLDSIYTENNFGAIATIPDVLDFPFFHVVQWNGLELDEEQAQLLTQVSPLNYDYQKGNNPFLLKGKNAEGNRFATENDFILFSLPLERVKCNFLGSLSPLPTQYYLDLEEQQFLQNRINQYNAELNRIALEYNYALVDFHALFKKIGSGYLEKGIDFNFDYLTGQFFSLDGLYPTHRGYGLIINEIVSSINKKYQSGLKGVNITGRKSIIFPD